jgi:pimeloyl-ACP methyl ester carboxylesterase
MALVLILGFMLDGEMWVSFEREMEDFHPVFHADLSRDDSIAGMARRVIAEVPDRFILIGFSLGGYVAREVARLAPEVVSALVLVATSSRADTPEQAQRKAAAAALVSRPFKGLSRGALRASVHPGRRSDEDLIGRMREVHETTNAHGKALRRNQRAIRYQVGPLARDRVDVSGLAEGPCWPWARDLKTTTQSARPATIEAAALATAAQQPPPPPPHCIVAVRS